MTSRLLKLFFWWFFFPLLLPFITVSAKSPGFHFLHPGIVGEHIKRVRLVDVSTKREAKCVVANLLILDYLKGYTTGVNYEKAMKELRSVLLGICEEYRHTRKKRFDPLTVFLWGVAAVFLSSYVASTITMSIILARHQDQIEKMKEWAKAAQKVQNGTIEKLYRAQEDFIIDMAKKDLRELIDQLHNSEKPVSQRLFEMTGNAIWDELGLPEEGRRKEVDFISSRVKGCGDDQLSVLFCYETYDLYEDGDLYEVFHIGQLTNNRKIFRHYDLEEYYGFKSSSSNHTVLVKKNGCKQKTHGPVCSLEDHLEIEEYDQLKERPELDEPLTVDPVFVKKFEFFDVVATNLEIYELHDGNTVTYHKMESSGLEIFSLAHGQTVQIGDTVLSGRQPIMMTVSLSPTNMTETTLAKIQENKKRGKISQEKYKQLENVISSNLSSTWNMITVIGATIVALLAILLIVAVMGLFLKRGSRSINVNTFNLPPHYESQYHPTASQTPDISQP